MNIFVIISQIQELETQTYALLVVHFTICKFAELLYSWVYTLSGISPSNSGRLSLATPPTIGVMNTGDVYG